MPARSSQRRVVRSPGRREIPRVPDVHERSPGSRDRPGRPRPGHGGGGVEAAEPVRRHEQLLPGELVGAVQDDRDTLGRVAVLVHVGRHGGDARDAKIEGHVQPAQFGQVREEEASHARVDVAQDATRRRQCRNVSDGVDHAVRVARRGSDNHDRVARAGSCEGGRRDAVVRPDRDADEIDVEVVGGFREHGVRTLTDHDAGSLDAAGRARRRALS